MIASPPASAAAGARRLALSIAGVRVDLVIDAAVPPIEARYARFAGAAGPARWTLEVVPGAGAEPDVAGPVRDEAGRWRLGGLESRGELRPATGRGVARVDQKLVLVNGLVRAAVAWDVLAAGGLLLHAAAIRVEGGAHLCPGRSGAGKSTLAFRSRALISDEVAAVLPEGDGWRVHGTPWWTTAAPPTPLAGLYELAWGDEDIAPADGRRGLRHLLANLVLPHEGPAQQRQALAAAARLAAAFPLRRLTFRRDTDVDALVRRAGPARRVA